MSMLLPKPKVLLLSTSFLLLHDLVFKSRVQGKNIAVCTSIRLDCVHACIIISIIVAAVNCNNHKIKINCWKIYHYSAEYLGERQSVLPPLAYATLERLRRRKLKERRLYDLIQEVIIYSLFLMVIWTISYSNRDPRAFDVYDTVASNIIDDEETGFRQVSICLDH